MYWISCQLVLQRLWIRRSKRPKQKKHDLSYWGDLRYLLAYGLVPDSVRATVFLSCHPQSQLPVPVPRVSTITFLSPHWGFHPGSPHLSNRAWWTGVRRLPTVFQILENTPQSHVDHSSLKLALERAEELCSQVNEGVREKENSDRLEWIQAHVQCEGLAEVRLWAKLGTRAGSPSILPCRTPLGLPSYLGKRQIGVFVVSSLNFTSRNQ